MTATAANAPQPMSSQSFARILSEDDQAQWKKKIEAAKADRRRFEPAWKLNLAFAAGKQWLEWQPFGRGGRFILPRLKHGQQRYTVDKITDLRMTVLGEFTMDDDRPQLLFRTDDLPTEDFAAVANDALAAGWETEWLGDRVMVDVKRSLIDLGTAAARCRFDPTAGPKRVKDVPHGDDGQPILDPDKAASYVADAHAAGRSANLKTLHEGRIRWDHGSVFNLLVPPGIKREDKFPWECWVEPVHIDKIREQYGSLAEGLKPEPIDDLTSMSEQESSVMGGSDPENGPAGSAKLEDHLFLYTIYQRPCRDWPDGRVIVLAGSTLRPMETRPKLPYVSPDGTRRSGIHYFHYIRLSDRFWGRSLLDLAKEPQRLFNRRRSQMGEHIDRGQAYILADERSIPKRIGVPMEVVKTKAGFPPPQPVAGVPLGDWMFKDLDQISEDMREATGLQDVLQGENPQNVGNYSQLALLQEQAGRKFDSIISEIKETVAHLVEDSVYAIRQYWGPEKFLALEGDDGTLKAFSFDATKVPDFYRVYVAKGAAKPRSQAAELKKVDDLAAYSINSGQPLPIDWVARSYDEGKPADLPETDRHDDLDKALFENEQLGQGQVPQVEYYEDHALHVQVHRTVQARADATGDLHVSAACEQHIQAHLQQAQANAQAQATGQQPQNVTAPPPGQTGQPSAEQGANPILAALVQAIAPQPAGTPPDAAQGIPNPYSLFPGSSTDGRSNFGI